MCKALGAAGLGCSSTSSSASWPKPGQLLPASSMAAIAKAVGMTKAKWHAGQMDTVKEELTKCEQETDQLTSKIWAARRAARTARTTRTLAEARGVFISATELPLVTDLGTQATDASSALTPTWAPISGAKDTWERSIADSLTALQSVETDTGTYAGAATGDLIRAVANALPAAVASVRSLVTQLEQEVSQSCDFLVTSETELQALFSGTSQQLATRASALQQEGTSANATAQQADGEAKREEDAESTLLGQRNITDAQCDAMRLNATDVGRYKEISQRATAAMGRLGELS